MDGNAAHSESGYFATSADRRRDSAVHKTMAEWKTLFLSSGARSGISPGTHGATKRESGIKSAFPISGAKPDFI
jgi:hypothetical protein